MARKNGCKFIGIDVCAEYLDIAIKRMSQSSLFDTLADIEPSEQDA